MVFLVGGTSGITLFGMYWFRGIDLREHGLHAGTTFIPWNSVATFKARPGKKDDECLLTVRGRFLLPRRFKIRQCNANQIEKFIHGACRFEPQPLGRRLLFGGIGLFLSRRRLYLSFQLGDVLVARVGFDGLVMMRVV